MISRRPLRRFLATAALTLVVAPVVATVASTQGAAETGSYRVLGKLPAVKGPQLKNGRSQSIWAIDAPSRRLFMRHPGADDSEYVVTYSLKTRIPTQVGIGKVGVIDDFPTANNFTAAFDSRRGNLALLSGTTEKDGHAEQFDLGNVVVYSDGQHKKVAHWNLIEQLPGYVPTGITYSAKDDRYYLVGDFSVSRQLSSGFGAGLKIVGPVSAVVSVNPVDGKVQFVKPVPECQQVLYSNGIGSLIARGTAHDAVYFACVTSGSPAGTTHPGQAGLVRAFVKPTGNSADAAQWSTDFFPISGNYFSGGSGSGIAAFDRTTDRFYMQSISFKTPGAFVFDGRLSAWVGFVAADVPLNYFNGINEGLGHFYMALSSGASKDTTRDGIIIADVRQTPVPAGESVKLSTGALIVADALSRRFFMRPKVPGEPYLVVEDLTEETHAEGEIDYDADTTDTADTAQAQVFYGLGATGYGMQSVQVGGASSPTTMIGKPSENLPKVAANTRALMTSRVGAVDLRSGGAAASGQAALPDYNTIGEYEAERGPDSWPYPVNSCLDAGGEPVTDQTVRDDGPSGPANGGSSQVTCDQGKNLVKAAARMGATGQGTMHAAKSGFDAMAYRNTAEGGVVRTRASAAAVTFELAGGYEIRFGSVVATSNVVAHGRPGTAHAVWTRDVDGVRVTGPTGETVFTAPGCASKVEVKANRAEQSDTCIPLAATLNRLLQTRLRIGFPMPLASATPKGAFAGIEQSAAEYFNQSVVNDQGVVYRGDSVGLRPTPAVVTEVYNDTTERSRTVTVLAATQSYAIFTVQPPYDDGWVPTDPVVPPAPPTVDAPAIVPTETEGDVPVAAPPAAPAPQIQRGGIALPVADVKGWLFLRRSLKDVALMLLLSGLVLGAAGTSWRRRRLVDVLVTVPRKEAL